MTIRVTLAFLIGRASPTETHYHPASDFSGATLHSILLANARAALLGTGASLTDVRLSVVDTPRDVQYIPDVLYTKVGTWPTVLTDERLYNSDIPNVSLRLRASNNGHVKQWFLAGIPDGVIRTGANFPGNFQVLPSFADPLAAYAQQLIDNWLFRVRTFVTAYRIVALRSSNLFPGLVGVNLDAEPVARAGDRVYIKGARRLNTRSPSIAGVWTVAGRIATVSPDSGPTLFLLGSQGVDLNNFDPLGSLYNDSFAYEPYANITPRKGTTHKRGGSFGAPVGRSKSQR